jgi:hypothetical protein
MVRNLNYLWADSVRIGAAADARGRRVVITVERMLIVDRAQVTEPAARRSANGACARNRVIE